jgi:hypothetical protein
MRTRRLGVFRQVGMAVFIAAAAISVLPGAVHAALWLVLDYSEGSAGEEIHGFTGGNGAFSEEARGQKLPLYLAPSGQDVDGPSDPALISLGFLTVDEQGNGSTTFLVPAAKAGSYELILDCPTCAPFSGGQRMTGVGTFEIVAAPDTGNGPGFTALGELHGIAHPGVGAGVGRSGQSDRTPDPDPTHVTSPGAGGKLIKSGRAAC